MSPPPEDVRRRTAKAAEPPADEAGATARMPGFLPWQTELAGRWLADKQRFAHAWLLHGQPGIGKRQFALAAAASLLCETPRDGLACGACLACRWFAGGNHPDVRRLRPDAVAVAEEGAAEASDDEGGSRKAAPSRDIRIEQLRALSDWFNTATHRGGWRVAVLYPAEALNHVSANALLKVLEEPPAHTVFLLVADAPDRLLPTLVSRCRRLPLPVPDTATSLSWLQAQGLDDAGQWLAAAGGTPLRALAQAQAGGSACPAWLRQLADALAADQAPNVGPLADALEKTPAAEWLDTLQRWFADLSFCAAGLPPRYFPALAPQTGAVAGRAAPQRLAEAARWLAQQQALASHPLNARLFLHSTLQRMVRDCSPARAVN